jgi:hypothetical protein
MPTEATVERLLVFKSLVGAVLRTEGKDIAVIFLER